MLRKNRRIGALCAVAAFGIALATVSVIENAEESGVAPEAVVLLPAIESVIAERNSQIISEDRSELTAAAVRHSSEAYRLKAENDFVEVRKRREQIAARGLEYTDSKSTIDITDVRILGPTVTAKIVELTELTVAPYPNGTVPPP